MTEKTKRLLIFTALAMATGGWFLFSTLYHYHFDWVYNFRAAALALLQTGNPYSAYVYSPPWLYVLLLPLALLPAHLGGAIVSTLTMLAFGYTAHRLGARPGMIALLLCSPYVIFSALNAQVDFLVVLGFLMPAQLGLFLVMIKPQIGLGVAIYWAAMAWKKGGLPQLIKTFSPLGMGYLISYALYGPWAVLPKFGAFIGANYDWDASIFPYSLPVGLALLIYAIQKEDKFKAIAAAPFMSPYVGVYSWAVPMLGLIPNQAIFNAVALSTWFISWWAAKPDFVRQLFVF